jgi:RNA methyltransferase, TrmH family
MLSKNQIKLVNSLKMKKFRDEHRLFIAEGTKLVPELLKSSFQIHSLYGTTTWIRDNNYLLQGRNELQERVFEVDEKELSKISQLTVPNEVLVLAHIPEQQFFPEKLKGRLSMVLDEVKDPGNLGTLIRIADWFGIENIICSPDSVDVYNSKVVQSTMGSVTRINVFYTGLKDFLRLPDLKMPVYGALLEGENIYEASLGTEGFILLGNESRGISPELLSFITHKITIPRSGGAESLNVSAAAAVICSEFRRRGPFSEK